MKKALIIIAVTISIFICASPVMASDAYNQYFTTTKARAETGDAKAEAALGIAYLSGHGGVAEDDAEAVKWLQKAADQNDATGETFLGSAYAHGKGVAVDKVAAVKLWTKASDQGNTKAKTFLGMAYLNGAGVPQDKDTGVNLLREAADGGEGGAADILRLMHVPIKAEEQAPEQH